MPVAVTSVLVPWENFYVIIGSASAALTGLMFVVITLIAGTQQTRSDDVLSAFGTPTVVHFCAALLIAAILSAPWQVLWNVSLLLGLCGLGGVLYTLIIARRFRRQNSYSPVLEDWAWHVILPFTAYIALLISACILPVYAVTTLFVIAAATVTFLFIGIHNSWDSVTYTTLIRLNAKDKK